MEHRIVLGGESFLPFARSRIKALRAAGLTYASQSFEVDGVSIKVRIEPGHEYIRLEGGTDRFTLACYGPDPLGGVAVAEFFTIKVPSGRVKKLAEYKAGTFNGCAVYNAKPYALTISTTESPNTFTLPYSAYVGYSVSHDYTAVGSYTQSVTDVTETYGAPGTSLFVTRVTSHGAEDHVRHPVPAGITTRTVVKTIKGAIRSALTYSYTLGFVMKDQLWDQRSQQWAASIYFSPTSPFPALTGLVSHTPTSGRYDTPLMTAAQNLAGYNEASGGEPLIVKPVVFRSAQTPTAPLEVVNSGDVYAVNPARFMGRLDIDPLSGTMPPYKVSGYDAVSGKVMHTAFKKTVFTFCDDPETPEILLNQRDAITGELTGVNVMIPVSAGYNYAILSESSSLSARVAQREFIHLGANYALFEWYVPGYQAMINALKHGSRDFVMDIFPDIMERRSTGPLYTAQASQRVYVVAPDFYDVRKM